LFVELKLAADVRVSADDGGGTLLDPSTGRIFVGNRVAALILLSASDGLTIDKTAEEIAARFGTTRRQAERDIRAFVQELQRNRLAVRGAEKP
jgi:Coenzyme PQQ synthesis protein D (PqqD)